MQIWDEISNIRKNWAVQTDYFRPFDYVIINFSVTWKLYLYISFGFHIQRFRLRHHYIIWTPGPGGHKVHFISGTRKNYKIYPLLPKSKGILYHGNRQWILVFAAPKLERDDWISNICDKKIKPVEEWNKTLIFTFSRLNM